MQNGLVVRFSSLGDVTLSSATVLNLKINFPRSRLTYLTKERYRNVVSHFDGVDEIVTVPDHVSAGDFVRLALDLDDRGYDTIVDLHGSLRSWLLRKTVSAGIKLVYPKRRRERRRLVRTNRIPAGWPHTIDLYNNTIEQLGLRIICRRPVMHPSDQLPDDLAGRSLHTAAENGFILLAPEAAHANKEWPLERFVDLASRLHESHRALIGWAVTSAERVPDQLRQRLPSEALLTLVDLPLDSLAALIRRARLVVSNDSGVMHLSTAVGTPGIALFGPTHPALGFAPRGLFDRVVEVEEPCRPCSLHGSKPCYREERFCFTRITAEDVHAVAAEVLAVQSSPALILDRDGTLMPDRDYRFDPGRIEFFPGAIEALIQARSLGFKLVVASNQSGVARGYFGTDDVEKVNAAFLSQLAVHGVQIDGMYYCPHHPAGSVREFTATCGCRKPAPGMVEDAAGALHLDLRRSYVIGDKRDDVNLGRAIGARSILVRTGYGKEEEQGVAVADNEHRVRVCDDLRAAVLTIKQDLRS